MGGEKETPMRHLPLNDVARRLAREVACVRCYQRPPGSETLGPEAPRTCEAACPLFAHLPTLVALSGHVGDRPGDCETTVRLKVCGVCHLRPSSGEYCAEYENRTCPLSRYADDVVTGLQRILASAPREATDARACHDQKTGDHAVRGVYGQGVPCSCRPAST